MRNASRPSSTHVHPLAVLEQLELEPLLVRPARPGRKPPFLPVKRPARPCRRPARTQTLQGRVAAPGGPRTGSAAARRACRCAPRRRPARSVRRPTVRSPCRFRKRGTEYDREYGTIRMSGGANATMRPSPTATTPTNGLSRSVCSRFSTALRRSAPANSAAVWPPGWSSSDFRTGPDFLGRQPTCAPRRAKQFASCSGYWRRPSHLCTGVLAS